MCGCLVRVFRLALPHQLFVLLTYTSDHACGVFGVLYRSFLTPLALETDKKHGKRKEGISECVGAWCVYVALPCRADCFY